MLSEVDKIYFCFPVTTTTAEHSFSLLCRIKSMSQNRLNNLFLLYVYKDKTDELSLNEIAKEFVSVNTRRLHCFSVFLYYTYLITLLVVAPLTQIIFLRLCNLIRGWPTTQDYNLQHSIYIITSFTCQASISPMVSSYT